MEFRVLDCMDSGVVQEVADMHAGQKLIGEMFKERHGGVLMPITHMTAYFCLEKFSEEDQMWRCVCSQLKD